MIGLANYVMRGRLPALLVTVAGASSMMFCWVSAAVIALVTLRKGVGDGAWLLMWALLPAGLLLFYVGDSGPVAMLVGAMFLALVLRTTVSLSAAILASVAVGVVTGLAMLAFGSQLLDQLVVFFAEFLGNLEQQLSQGNAEAVVLNHPTALQVAGMLGAVSAVSSVMCLLLARYWQAALYNPGGFGEEFRAMLLSPAVTVALVLPALGIFALGVEYQTWAMILMVPLTFAGLALVHARAKQRGRGTGWLTGFYLAWLILDPVKLVVVVAAIADSWIGFRQRWAKQASED
ncbi:MAG: hypothetical protein IMF06_04105 [Proteobacteria bacterium]|nr:hypothetical protein [Pseudomonadota bacterium]